MALFEKGLSVHLDSRISTLAQIKARSLGADTLVLSSLTVLAYAQLEGGVKDLSVCAISHLNRRNLELGELAPNILNWRNRDELDRLRSKVDFDMIGAPTPFGGELKRQVSVKQIQKRYELNQMDWPALKEVYAGFGLDPSGIERFAGTIDGLVEARNEAAHNGTPPKTAAALMEGQLRDSVGIVEHVLYDISYRLLTFFSDQLHLRKTRRSLIPHNGIE